MLLKIVFIDFSFFNREKGQIIKKRPKRICRDHRIDSKYDNFLYNTERVAMFKGCISVFAAIIQIGFLIFKFILRKIDILQSI